MLSGPLYRKYKVVPKLIQMYRGNAVRFNYMECIEFSNLAQLAPKSSHQKDMDIKEEKLD